MRYRDLRFPTDVQVTVDLGEAARRAWLVNVSLTGAKLAGVGGLPRDALLRVAHLNASHAARVAWSGGDRTGIRWVRPLTAGELAVLRREGGWRPGPWAPPGGTHGLREMT